jgi:hypothetical protein
VRGRCVCVWEKRRHRQMKPGILLRIFYSTSQLCTALHALHRSAVTHPHFHPRPHSPGVSTSTIHLASPHAHAHHFERARTHRRDETRRDKSLITPSSPPLPSCLPFSPHARTSSLVLQLSRTPHQTRPNARLSHLPRKRNQINCTGAC